jgi:hypothetical protein
MNKVHGGTISEHAPSLCASCRSCASVQGPRSSQLFQHCQQTGKRVLMVVTACSMYSDKSQPSLWDLEQIAWVLTTSPGRKIGFVSPMERERTAVAGPPAQPATPR